MDDKLIEEMFEKEERYWWFQARREIILSVVKRFLINRENPKILDVGCGSGFNAYYISKHFQNITGVDTSPKAVELTRKRGLKAVLGSLPHDISFEEESFDAVTLFDVLEHMDEDRESIKKASTLLRPGGVIVASVPAHPFMWTRRDKFHNHKRRYTKKGFESIFQLPCLEKKLFSYYNTFLFPIILASRLSSRIFGYDKEGPDINLLPGPVNTVLRWIFGAERHLIGRFPLITGVSLIAVYSKRSEE